MVRINVARESQPFDPFSVAVWVPACVKVNPFQMYGNSLLHILMLELLLRLGVTVRFKVASESQPFSAFNVTVWVPACVNVNPFQIYGN